MILTKNKMTDLLENEENIWEFVKCLFESSSGKQLVKHQIDSYNDFVKSKIGEIKSAVSLSTGIYRISAFAC